MKFKFIKTSLLSVVVALITFSVPASASLIFTFSDNGSSQTLLTASGSVDLSGSTAASSPWNRFIGWDNFGSTGVNDSKALVADSNFFNFNDPTGGCAGFCQFNTVLGANALTVGGLTLATTNGLWMDRPTSSNSRFFVLDFGSASALPQTGVVTASGSAVLDFSFANLPYAAGTSIDLQNNQSVIFQFGKTEVPEPSTLAIFALGLIGLASRRFKKQS